MPKTPIRGDKPFLVFGSPLIMEAEVAEVIDTMHSGWLGTGPKVAKFEKAFSAYKGLTVGHAAAVNSCTAALHVSMLAAGLQPGDEVITTPMTFCATVNAIIHAGLTPVLADIEEDSFNLDPAAVEAAITPQTKALLLVHFAGRPCNMDAMIAIAEKHNLILIEDCAHAIETEYKGKKAGTFGQFGCFSFYVTKNVVTGEGGMVLAKDEAAISRVKTLALHGMSKDAWHRFGDSGYKHYQVVEIGFKYNMMDIQAAIGVHQLARVEENWKRRRDIWMQYQQAFSDLPVIQPMEPENDTKHAYHLYTIRIDEESCGIKRDHFLDAMTSHGIGVGVHYLSIPEHPVYQQHYGWNPEAYPRSQKVGRQTVSLPLSPKLTDEDVTDVIMAVRQVVGDYAR